MKIEAVEYEGGRLILTAPPCQEMYKFIRSFAPGEYSIVPTKKKRSLSANGYAWSLMEALATALRTDKNSVYEDMLRRYGAGESYTDESGNVCRVMFSLREDVPPGLVSAHYAEIGQSFLDGKRFIHYRAIKGSSEYDTHEMSVFIDGIVSECQMCGIETATPEQLARYVEDWKPCKA